MRRMILLAEFLFIIHIASDRVTHNRAILRIFILLNFIEKASYFSSEYCKCGLTIAHTCEG